MMKVLLISPDRCIGCGSCEVACSLSQEGECRPVLARIKVFRFDLGVHVPLTCLQCEDAPCASVCRTGALEKDPQSGVIKVHSERCIGCRMCVIACPFGNISYSPEGKSAFKCTECEGDPQCVRFCPTEALQYVPAEKDNLEKKRAYAAKFAAIEEEVRQ
ncbi:MAG TPA: 4Fe-4S ferredoxin [Aminobacterium sp.]|uniref:4Fe-4S dicluster domain-containing protein n=1 Tax=Aminobacterium TaxID=81466 RepID=UPI000EE01C90|nr:4Fe-4S dicluster domain-containing protein [Aminobacterium sp. UBA4834]HCA40268.1 4Fe-4S ferredoxin [Aminobacterium sp.]